MPGLPSLPSIPAGALPAGIDAIFVVHAAKFVDRRKLIHDQLDAIGLPFQFVLDFDIPAITDTIRQRFFSKADLSPAQQSCALKHWHAHQLVVQRKLSRALIFEDDVILAPDFMLVFNRMMREELGVSGPHVTFLGCGGHYYVDPEALRSNQLLYPGSQGKFADSYIVSLEAATRRCDWIAANGIPLPIDHLFEKIDRELATPMFWLEPPIVEQGSHNGTFGSALDRSHARWFQALQYRWKKMWRRRRHR